MLSAGELSRADAAGPPTSRGQALAVAGGVRFNSKVLDYTDSSRTPFPGVLCPPRPHTGSTTRVFAWHAGCCRRWSLWPVSPP